jgi:pimeloyl-ACP methyl ester carboxylesterase
MSTMALRGRVSVRAGLLTMIIAMLGLSLGVGTAVSATRHHHAPSAHHATGSKPTIVLVHGAWADASSWDGVTERLQRQGYTVIAPANPLRGPKSDSAYLASVLATISGPIVLVGHSYGGFVITDAATGNPNVKALVYIDAFAPEAGESVSSIEAINPGSELLPSTVTVRPGPEGAEVYIDPSAFRRVFCADLPPSQAALLAADQRPLLASAEAEASGPPAWKTIPSWYMVGTEDHAIPPATERFMAKRMHATTVEVKASHVAMISHPEATTQLILDAAHSAG